MQLLNLAYHGDEEVYAMVDQIFDHNYPLHDMDEMYFRALAQSFRGYSFSYANGLMTVNFSSVVNLAGATCTTAVHHIHGERVLKEHYFKVMLDGLHQCRSVELVRGEHHMAWAAKLFFMQYAFCIDGKPINPAQEIKLSKIVNISTAIVRCETSFTDTMQSVLNYVPAF